MMARFGVGLVLALGLFAAGSYLDQIQEWRQQREARLRSDDGWLTVAGLHWLEEGRTPFGADPSNKLVLPAGFGRARGGYFELRGGKVILEPAPGADLRVGVAAATRREMRPDTAGKPDIVSAGTVTMHVIERAGRFGIRVKDRNSKARREFKGLHWFPVDESWRVTAKFVAHPGARSIAVPNVLGQVERMPSPGYVTFRLAGREMRLDPVVEDGELFFIFRDSSSGKETYPSGRFLYTEMPKNGRVTLDFNKAQNPPCAFTPYATCPLPPRQNRLPVAIRAGERFAGH